MLKRVVGLHTEPSAAELTKHAETKVDGDDHDLSVASQHAAIVRVAGVPLVRFAVDVHDDGQRGRRLACNKGQYWRV